MTSSLPSLTLARHGETEWSLAGRHTGRTDLPLTPKGEAAARALGDRLRATGAVFDRVLTSPLQRAANTCRLAGFGDAAEPEPALLEWDYGAFEGRTTPHILSQHPGWQLFRDGCPDGETAADVGARVDALLARLRPLPGATLMFSSAHVLRVLAARWLGLPPDDGRLLVLGTASISVLGYEHNADEPVIRGWNAG